MTDGLKIARDCGRGKAEDAYKLFLQEDCPCIVVVDKKTIAFEFNEHYSDLGNLRQFLEIRNSSNYGNAPDSDSKFGKKGRASTVNPKFTQSSGKVRVFIRLISQNARDLLILGVRCFQAKKGLFTDKI
jgi:glutaredoxin-related protein